MSVPRRNILRPPAASPALTRLPQLRCRLEDEQMALRRWMIRLRRAFHAMEKQQRRVARLEKQIAKLETQR